MAISEKDKDLMAQVAMYYRTTQIEDDSDLSIRMTAHHFNERIPQSEQDRSSRYSQAGDSRKGYNMETNLKSTAAQNQVNSEQTRQSKIIIRRTFGDQNFLELYADFVAGKIMEEMTRAKEPTALLS